MRRRRPSVVLILLTASATLACGAATAAVRPPGDAVPSWSVWLCRPDLPRDYCRIDLSATFFAADGTRRVEPAATPKQPVDCFYVYPTVSSERRGNADLQIQPEEKQVANIEAARFGQVCRLFAPMYRQTTSYSQTLNGDPELAYADVLAAWKDYLAHYNRGRGVVLIGHSQGAFVLKRLIQSELDRSPSTRRLLVSALLLGGDVVVANGSDVGGDFRHVRICSSSTQTGCVVAYSTWSRTPPRDAAFESVPGRAQHVVCVNPAAPAGGAAPVTPLFPFFGSNGLMSNQPNPPVQTVWIGFPDRYTARCVRQGERAWLLVTARVQNDVRPVVQEILAPSWGLHAADVNVALANLIALVRTQSAAWIAHH